MKYGLNSHHEFKYLKSIIVVNNRITNLSDYNFIYPRVLQMTLSITWIFVGIFTIIPHDANMQCNNSDITVGGVVRLNSQWGLEGRRVPCTSYIRCFIIITPDLISLKLYYKKLFWTKKLCKHVGIVYNLHVCMKYNIKIWPRIVCPLRVIQLHWQVSVLVTKLDIMAESVAALTRRRFYILHWAAFLEFGHQSTNCWLIRNLISANR